MFNMDEPPTVHISHNLSSPRGASGAAQFSHIFGLSLQLPLAAHCETGPGPDPDVCLDATAHGLHVEAVPLFSGYTALYTAPHNPHYLVHPKVYSRATLLP